jgi:flagellar basal body-associated protein FliL
MEPQNPGSEPQFSGEVMKAPAGVPAETASTPVNRGPLFGVIIGLLFVALVLVLGGLMFWNYLLIPAPITIDTTERPGADINQEPESTTAQAQADAAATLSTSNELPAIEADLLSTDLSSLETELTSIDLMIESTGNATTTAP